MRILLLAGALLVALAGCSAEDNNIVISPAAAGPLLTDRPLPPLAIAWQDRTAAYAESIFGDRSYAAVFGAQVHQESAWNCRARSKFAAGCSQFTPATAKWVGAGLCRWLGTVDVQDPGWAIPCQIRYMRWISDRLSATTGCDRMAFALSGYNGGSGFVKRDKRLCSTIAGCDPERWYGNVELQSKRADWAFEENRGYPRRIQFNLVPRYLRAGWPGVDQCE